MTTQQYSSEDIKQILTIAMGRESSSPVQLQEMAAELSIDKVTLDYAVDVWQGQKAKAQAKQQRRQRFYRQSVLPYGVVNGFLIVLDVVTTGGMTWSIYPLLGWGVGLLLEAVTGVPLGSCDRSPASYSSLGNASLRKGEPV